jgi:hypothetical protein
MLSCALASASEAMPDFGAPSGGPLPRLIPQAPGAVDAPTPEQKLLWDIGRGLLERDQRIAELGARLPAGVRLPAERGVSRPEIEQPRRERDQALAELQRALETFGVQRGGGHDPLETARPAAKAAQAGPIAAINQLRIAECYQELAHSSAAAADLSEGAKALAACDVSQLPGLEQPRYYYLQTWFAAESARHATGEERAKFLTQAQDSQRLLAGQFPGLELTVAAQALTLDLLQSQVQSGVP